jgi:hypothetical protein
MEPGIGKDLTGSRAIIVRASPGKSSNFGENPANRWRKE